MSWETYRDNLIASGNVDQVAIIGAEDCTVWTQSPGFNVQPAEARSIVTGFTNVDSLSEKGITVGGTKYFFLTSDDKQIQGKKGAAGVSIGKSVKCVIVATYKEGQQPGNARKVVENMCDWLRTNNY